MKKQTIYRYSVPSEPRKKYAQLRSEQDEQVLLFPKPAPSLTIAPPIVTTTANTLQDNLVSPTPLPAPTLQSIAFEPSISVVASTNKAPAVKQQQESAETIDTNIKITPASQHRTNYTTNSKTKHATVVTKQASERTQLILDAINKHQIILRQDVRKILHEAYPQQSFDSKSVNRIVDSMEKQGLVKQFFMSVPTLVKTQKEHAVVMRPELTMEHELVKEFMKKVKEFKRPIPQLSEQQQQDMEHIQVDHIVPSILAHDGIDPSAPAAEVRSITTTQVTYRQIRNGYLTSKMLRIKVRKIDI